MIPHLTLSDPIIVHDQRPTHTANPDALHDADVTRRFAWAQAHCLIDDPDATQAQREHAIQQAEAADAWYWDVYDYYHACTCNGTEAEACRACKARSGEEIPYV